MGSEVLAIVPGAGLSGLLEGRANQPIVDVTFTGFKEVRRGSLGFDMGTTSSFKEKTYGLAALRKNVLWGRGETLGYYVGLGKDTFEQRLEVMQPYVWGRGAALFQLFNRTDTYALRQYAEGVRGAHLSVRNADDPHISQEYNFGLNARNFKAGDLAPPQLLTQDGITAKGFASHTIRINKGTSLETSPGFLVGGSDMEFANEVGYVAGVTPFVKSEVKARFFHGLVDDLLGASVGFSLGAILTPPGLSASPSDRFYPVTIGFLNHVATPSQAVNPSVPHADASEPNPAGGAGARADDWPPRRVNADGSAHESLTPTGGKVGTLGAGLYINADARIKANIPVRLGIPIHAQAFVNAGVGYKDPKDYLTGRRSAFSDTKDFARVNCGVGLVASVMGSAIQINVSFPLVYKATDRIARININTFPSESL